MWKQVREREIGGISTKLFSSRIKSNRISSLQLSNHKDIVSAQRGAINSLQVDLTEGRYLLSGGSDASVAVYDVQRATEYVAGGLVAKHKNILLVDKQHEHGHKYAISSAIWYPVDTGLFVTGSYDHFINVWDTNTTQVVMNFKMPGKVYKTAMSSVATSHMLIAAGTEDVQVRLCDIASGAFSHTLSGHRGTYYVPFSSLLAYYGGLVIWVHTVNDQLAPNFDGVMAVEWSTSSEWVLLTGGCDGAIRFWDIRRAGCFSVLNQSHTQLGRRPPLQQRATNKVSTSKSSSTALSTKFKATERKHSNGNGSKHNSVTKRNLSQVKASAGKRIHPGFVSSQDRSTAHYGAVIGLKMTLDGLYLLSAGSDSRLRLWDVESCCNTLVNFDIVRLQTSKAMQLAITPDSDLVFVPCMSTVKAFGMWSGQTMLSFRGHYDNVNSCWFNAQDQELYTGGSDRQILVWSPSKINSDPEDEWNKKQQGDVLDQDNWSD